LLLRHSIFPLNDSFSLSLLPQTSLVSDIPLLLNLLTFQNAFIHVYFIRLITSQIITHIFLSDSSFRIQPHSYILSLITTSISHLHSYSLQSFFAHSDIAHTHLHTPQNNLLTFQLNTVSKLHSITKLKLSFSLGIWPVLHILRLSATTLDYSLESLIENGLLSLSDYSPLSPFFPGGYNSFLRHPIAQTARNVLSSDYSPLFSSIFQKLGFKKNSIRTIAQKSALQMSFETYI
jgi:hypothetical protein